MKFRPPSRKILTAVFKWALSIEGGQLDNKLGQTYVSVSPGPHYTFCSNSAEPW